jgi:hypothetical protein
MELAPGKPERLVRDERGAVNEFGPEATAIRDDPDSRILHRGRGLEHTFRLFNREGDVGARRSFNSQYELLNGQAGIDRTDREDRSVVVASLQRVGRVGATDAAILGQDRRLRVGLFPDRG